MADEFPRDDPAVTPDGPDKSAPARKGMLVVYHGPGATKEIAGLGVLFRANGRGLPVRHMRFKPDPRGEPSGDNLALEKLGIPSHVIDGPTEEAAAELWSKAVRHVSIVQEGVLVLEGLLDAIAEGWLSAAQVAEALSGKDSLLHVIVTGETAPSELLDSADLVSNMKAIKKRGSDAPVIAGIDY
ncbi:MAG: cob(I)yrinic acid a,c-diamide adenosyltransferase [Dehalococcoidia bacterium]|jgi:cob(I)alamin adenosyltransferase